MNGLRRLFTDRLTLRQRLIAIIFVVSAVASSLGFLVNGILEWREARGALVDTARQIARTAADYSSVDLVFGYPEAAEQSLGFLRSRAVVEQAFILDAEGEVFARLRPDVPLQPGIARDAAAVFGDDSLFVAEPIVHEGDRIGTLHLQVSTAELWRDGLQRLLVLALLLLMVLLVSFLLSLRLQRIVSEPILRLTDTARRISGRADFSERVPPPAEDEIGSLYRAFNVMLDRIQDHDRARAAAFDELASAHEALRRNEQELNAILELMPLVLYAKDATELRYVRFNRTAERMSGLSRERVIGRTDLEIFDTAQAEILVAQDRRALAGDGVLDIPEHVVDTPSGRRIVHSRKVVVHGSDGTPRYLLGISEDITERKTAEQERERITGQLQQAQKMQAIGQLTGGIAHDFNNILASILGYSSMALQRYRDELPDKVVHYLNHIERSGERGRDLVANMLAYARGQGRSGGTLVLEPHVLDVVQMLKATLPAGISLTTHLDRVQPPVHCDPVHLQQVLSNLALNARDALGGRGRIDVSLSLRDRLAATCSSCHEPFSGTFVELEVRDDGPGIAADDLDRLFLPFFTTKESDRGTGLGLVVVHGRVHEHGGHIGVESAPGGGSVFRAWWRVATRQQSADATPALPAAGRRPRLADGAPSVVIVDDEQSLTEMLTEVLRDQGCRVYPFNDPLLARDFVRSIDAPIDMLITDQNMPKMTGLELIRLLRRERPDLPTLLLSGHSNVVNRHNCKDLGVGELVEKPFDVMELTRNVMNTLSANRHH